MDVEVVSDSLVLRLNQVLRQVPVQRVLTDKLLLPENYVKQLFREQRVRIGNRNAQPDESAGGQRVRIVGGVLASSTPKGSLKKLSYSENNDGIACDGLDSLFLDVLYEDNHLLVVNKPLNVLIHGANPASNLPDLDSLVRAYLAAKGEWVRVRHIHRLDVGTSGTILYAKHDYMGRALDNLLFQRKVSRHYLACVQGLFKDKKGIFEDRLGRHRHVSGKYRISAKGKPAVTHYQVLQRVKLGKTGVTLVACTLETGRTHQIRVHFSAHGHPVIGDALYGGGDGLGRAKWESGMALHALMMVFVHPYTEERVVSVAPLPEPWNVLKTYMRLDSTIHNYCAGLLEGND